MLRTRSVDRLADLRGAVRDRVAVRHPPVNNLRDDAKIEAQRERLRKRAEREVLSALVRRVLSQAHTGELARAVFLKAMKELPRSPRSGGAYVDFDTDRGVWGDLAFRFSHLAKTYNGGSEQPEYAVFGLVLADLTDAELDDLVRQGCSRIPELKEVAAWSPAPSPA